jgi:hypothetical protein
MAATGVGFAGFSTFWPLLLAAFVGTLNRSSGDVGVVLPLEHARLASAASGHARTALFARYSVAGVLGAAVGALAAGLLDWLAGHVGESQVFSLRAMFLLYGVIGLVIWGLNRPLVAALASTSTLQRPRRSGSPAASWCGWRPWHPSSSWHSRSCSCAAPCRGWMSRRERPTSWPW